MALGVVPLDAREGWCEERERIFVGGGGGKRVGPVVGSRCFDSGEIVFVGVCGLVWIAQNCCGEMR